MRYSPPRRNHAQGVSANILYMSNPTKVNTPIIAVTAVVAGLFWFLYLYCYQTPTLAYAQRVLSGGVTIYRPLISALLIVVTLFIVQRLTQRLTGLYGDSHAMTYVPAMLLLALLTATRPDGHGGLTMAAVAWAVPVLAVAWLFALGIINQWIAGRTVPTTLLASATLSANLGILLLQMLFVALCGNGDELFHREIWAEKLLVENRYDLLADEGRPCGQLYRQTGLPLFERRSDAVSERTDTTLSLLRALALDRRGTIADSLFTQPVAATEGSMLRLEGVRPLLVRQRFLRRRHTADYRLCALLASRDLDAFARAMTRSHALDSLRSPEALPRHYREALVLYQHLRSQPLTAFRDPVLETDYRDLRDTLRHYPTPAERLERMRRQYGNTYWNYYFRTQTSVKRGA